jgi:NADPH-dependent 2,4-dienoyl-CoA reductase/sulfur reductase-like enzyme
VELLTDAPVDTLEPDAAHLVDGRRLPADVVVVGIGARPATGWLAGSGVTTDVRGAVVGDDHLRTARPGVFAVGDCATFPSRRFGVPLHVEHWDNALRAPAVVAANLRGGDAVHDPVPYFWSEQFGRMVQYVGHLPVADRLVARGDSSDRAWAVCGLRGDRLVAAVTVDRPGDLAAARRLIERGRPVDPHRVADPDVPLSQAAKTAPWQAGPL